MDCGRAAGRIALVALLLVTLVAAIGCAPAPVPTPSPTSSPISVASLFPDEPTASPPSSAAPSNGPAIGAAGSVVLLGVDGSLSVVDASGRSTPLAGAVAGRFGFPAWSPDGSMIAAIRSSPAESAIVVFDAAAAVVDGPPVEPVVILSSQAIQPFYLSWTPDSRMVSYLANEAGALSLRVAPADGSAPLDGSGPEATIGTGSPFYYDWIDADHLFAHVGSGAEAFLGEIERVGSVPGDPVSSPGAFRSAAVSADRSHISYVRAVDEARSEVVVAAVDGSDERVIPVFGFAAVGFDPTGATVASIGPVEPGSTVVGLPIGPLRLIGATEAEDRTLLDGRVLSYWWSPDGTTIAALRVQPVVPEAVTPVASGAATPIASDEVTNEARLVFIDVASGDIRSDALVVPAALFIDQLLTYFDQYALSHRLWSPDSRTLLFPIARPDGTTRVAVMPVDGGTPVLLDGQIGFWTP